MKNTIPPIQAPAIRSDGWLNTLQQQAQEARNKTLSRLAAERHHAWSHDELEEAFA
jgi:hypothetical protein